MVLRVEPCDSNVGKPGPGQEGTFVTLREVLRHEIYYAAIIFACNYTISRSCRGCRRASRAQRSSTVNERTDSGLVLLVHRGADLLELFVGGALSRFVLLLGAAAFGGFRVQFG